MILVDSSVWVDHFRRGNPVLAGLLDAGEVLIHPFIIGEIALGNLRNRGLILGDLGDLPRAVVAADQEVLDLISRNRLFGSGIGYIDAHLIAATLLTSGTLLWTRDKRLRSVAESLSLAAKN